MKPKLFKRSLLRGILLFLLCMAGVNNSWSQVYKLITSTAELETGKRYLIASMKDGMGYVMKNYAPNENNWKAIKTTATDNCITYQEGMAQLTLSIYDDKYAFHDGTYYMDATSTTSSNYLKGNKYQDIYIKFSITFANDVAVIKCTSKNVRNILRYNSESDLFSCYSDGQEVVYLYKEIPREVVSLSISENPTQTTYYVGDKPSATGLRVTATYDDESTKDVTSSVTWSFDPETISEETKTVTATATYGDFTASYEFGIIVAQLESLTITGTPKKTTYKVGESPSTEGLIVSADYSNKSTKDVTDKVNWQLSPEIITEDTKQIVVTAEYNGISVCESYDIVVDTDVLVYELVTTKNNNDMYGPYEETNQISINNITWDIIGRTDYSPWRFGGKNIYKKDRDIKSVDKIEGTVDKVVVKIGNSYEDITLNSLTLSVSNSSEFTAYSSYIEEPAQANTDYTFDITPATNAYYKIALNLTVPNQNSNSYIKFKGAEFYGTPKSTDVNVSDAGYATFCLPYTAKIPKGITAYTATDNGEYITLTPKTNGLIAANEGVILRGVGGTYTFYKNVEDVTADAQNLLVGVTEDKVLSSSDNAYMLTRNKETGVIAFRRLNTNYTLGANRAYLKLEGTQNSARTQIPAIWNEIETSITDVKREETGEGPIYNITGQKLSTPQRGINIINGKLIIR